MVFDDHLTPPDLVICSIIDETGGDLISKGCTYVLLL